MTDAEVLAALSERDTLQLTMLGEARGEEIEGRIAVGCVIRNRMRDPKRWPDVIKDCCLEKWQFSCWNRNDPNYPKLLEHARALVSDHAVRTAFVPTSLDLETRWVADGILTGVVRDRTSGSNHYLTRLLWKQRPPHWAKGQRPTAFIMRHVFFKL